MERPVRFASSPTFIPVALADSVLRWGEESRVIRGEPGRKLIMTNAIASRDVRFKGRISYRMPEATQSLTDVRVRVATPDDAVALSKLARRLFSQAFAESNTEDDMRLFLGRTFTTDAQRAELAD